MSAKSELKTYLEASGDKRDRTAEITEILEKYGFCELGPGLFTVSGVNVPEYGMLRGSGNSTVLYLNDEVREGYTVRLSTSASISDCRLTGGETAPEVSETAGTRHGVLWEGTYNVDKSFPSRGTVHNLTIQNYQGGGITCRNTGYPVQGGLNVTDCYIMYCDAGVNIPYWSEFNRFTNVHSHKCYYGLINNGGNNNFVNCCFSSNALGILMDNKDNQSPNNTHGSMIGCMVDHSGGNKGTGVRILNTHAGYIFTGCHFFFSKIEVIDSEGIIFSDQDAGKEEKILVSGGGLVIFSKCMYKTMPEITVINNDNVHFDSCYLRNGEKVKPV